MLLHRHARAVVDSRSVGVGRYRRCAAFPTECCQRLPCTTIFRVTQNRWRVNEQDSCILESPYRDRRKSYPFPDFMPKLAKGIGSRRG
jgi:hypothetical protein